MPPWAWAVLYYAVLLTVFRFLAYPYIHDSLERQTFGAGDTVGTTASMLAYLLLCLLPPYFWSRAGFYHPFWRGVEAFICYAGVALALGALLAIGESGGWTATSGLCAGSPAWARVGSLGAFFLAFLAASWWGGRKATIRKKGGKGRDAGRGATSR